MDINEIEEVIKEFENGTSLRDCAKKRKIYIDKLRRNLFELGGEKGKQVLIQELEMYLKVPIMEIVGEYKKNKSATQISSDYGISLAKLSSVMHKYEYITGEKVIPKRERPQFRDDLDREKIVRRYKRGEYINKIADDNDVYPSTIRLIVTKYEIEHGLDIDEEHKKNVEKQKDKVKNLKKASTESVYRVIKKYNYSFGQIEKAAKNFIKKMAYHISWQFQDCIFHLSEWEFIKS